MEFEWKNNTVNMISYLPLLLVLITVPLYAAFTGRMNMTYSMEKGPSFQSICGRNVLLPVNGYQHKLVSKGNAGGNCFSTLVVGLTSKLTCKICVDLEEQANWNLRADIMNITFTGEAENMLLKVGQVKFTETCFEGTRLDILVVEDEGYARKMANDQKPNNVYSFKFALKPKCSEEPICNSTVPINSSSNNNIITSTVPINSSPNNNIITSTVPINPSPNNNKMTCSNTVDNVSMSFSIINVLILFVLIVVNSYCYYNRKQQKSTNVEQHVEEDSLHFAALNLLLRFYANKPPDAHSGGNHGSSTTDNKVEEDSLHFKVSNLLKRFYAKKLLSAHSRGNHGSSTTDNEVEEDSLHSAVLNLLKRFDAIKPLCANKPLGAHSGVNHGSSTNYNEVEDEDSTLEKIKLLSKTPANKPLGAHSGGNHGSSTTDNEGMRERTHTLFLLEEDSLHFDVLNLLLRFYANKPPSAHSRGNHGSSTTDNEGM